MTPVDSYNSQCNYDELLKGRDNNKTLGLSNQCLLLYGNGDGGGGPTPRMLEKVCPWPCFSLTISSSVCALLPLQTQRCRASRRGRRQSSLARFPSLRIMAENSPHGKGSSTLSCIEG
jgi:hypothetical protein